MTEETNKTDQPWRKGPMPKTIGMREEENKADERWCELGEDRYGEFGVIGAEQADETHLDDRLREEDDDEDDFGADGRIHFAKEKLYGREEELAQCQELFDANEASVVFVSGYSGSGKSRVVEEFIIHNSTRTQSIIFLRSKSEASRAGVPFSSISGLFDSIPKSVSHEFINMRDEIQETLGNDARLLLKVFPKLEKYLEKDATGRSSEKTSSSDSVGDSSSVTEGVRAAKKQDTKKRMMLALQFFFRKLSSRSKRRLCLFVDDLQWVDLLSMELIESILTDTTINNLFFFGGYRSNEVDEGHMLIKKMQSIKEKREETDLTGYLRIELKDLHKEAIGEFIADSLRLSFEEVLPLTNAIFTKTLGNPFFTRQALQHLVLKNVLYYDNISFRWDWKLQERDLKDIISDDLLEMIKVKIEHIDPKLKEVLMTASCTRSTFDVETMLVLLNPLFLRQSQALFGIKASEEQYEEEKKALIGLLNQAVVEGLLIPQDGKRTSNLRYSINSVNADEATGNVYAFAHDKIQETARSLISSRDSELQFLERIGTTLSQRAQCPIYGEDWMLFTACEHLNHAAMLHKKLAKTEKQEEKHPNFMTKDKKFPLAVLNLRTAELSIDLLAFRAALDFCEQGISYLPASEEERWSERHRNTTLKLLSIAAQATYGIGQLDEAERYCNQVISQRLGSNPKVTTAEAIPAILIYLDIIVETGEKKAALEFCLQILSEFGISAPRNKRMLRAKLYLSLKQVKRRYMPTEESIQNMPQVKDHFVADKMELMRKAATLAYSADEMYLYMLLSCESVKHISKHGLTESSAASIASFANVLMHAYNDFKTSPKLADLAILIANLQQSKFSETQPLNTANSNVLCWVRPISSGLKYHERAYNSGIVSGNINGAMVGKWFAFKNKVYSCCITLPQLEEELQAGIAEMSRMKQSFMAGVVGVVWQLTLNLIGKSGNPNTTVLTGEAIDESTELYQQKMPTKVLFGFWKSFGLLLFGDYEAGAEDALKRGDEFPNLAIGMEFGFECVVRAIPLLIMARSDSSQKAKFRKSAMKLLKRVRRWVKNGCVNLVGVHQLMEAEFMALQKNTNMARSYFEMAITNCRKDNFLHFAGLSCELYSAYLAETGDSKGEIIYLQGAIEDYRRWGFARKVETLKKKLSDLGGEETTPVSKKGSNFGAFRSLRLVTMTYQG